ncbi:hypothetical protein [Micromonospora sp. NBRC 107095]|uniref:hypothetical protein n=1 Tax=Micromonospora sp. NBRC 107095 TaxID=3032209 RepID=UPI00249FA5E5|nr:hypothetical protein [Micromonospora sp. NBRC 107095]GLZ60912.1 hypothetical protein Misp05_44880 [Micromonospora sp. NBRC 107095]
MLADEVFALAPQAFETALDSEGTAAERRLLRYVYRVVDPYGQVIDVLVPAPRMLV